MNETLITFYEEELFIPFQIIESDGFCNLFSDIPITDLSKLALFELNVPITSAHIQVNLQSNVTFNESSVPCPCVNETNDGYTLFTSGSNGNSNDFHNNNGFYWNYHALGFTNKSGSDTVVEIGQTNDYYYKLYSNGFLEQGNKVTIPHRSYVNCPIPKPYLTNEYFIFGQRTDYGVAGFQITDVYSCNKTNNSFNFNVATNYAHNQYTTPEWWTTYGYTNKSSKRAIKLISSEHNRYNFKRIYENGWCEQGGMYLDKVTSSFSYNITLPQPYKDNNYFGYCYRMNKTDQSSPHGLYDLGVVGTKVINESTFQLSSGPSRYGSDTTYLMWNTKGFIE